MDVVMDTVGSAVARHVTACLHGTKCQMQWILGALGTPHGWAGYEGAVPDAAFPEVAHGQHGVIGRHGDAVWKRAAVHHLAQDAIPGILVNSPGAIRRAWSGTGSPRVSEEQIAFDIEIEVVGTFEQLIPVGIDQSADLLRLRVVNQNAAVPRRQVKLAVVPTRALRLTGLAQVRWRIAIESRYQLGVWSQVGNPSAADRYEPQIASGVERAAFEKLTLRRVADIGEFFDLADPGRQWRQAPRLALAGGLGLGGTGGGKDATDQHGAQDLDQPVAHRHDVCAPFPRRMSMQPIVRGSQLRTGSIRRHLRQ